MNQCLVIATRSRTGPCMEGIEIYISVVDVVQGSRMTINKSILELM